MKIIKHIITLAAVFLMIPAQCWSQEIFGQTYPIAEKDAVIEMQKAAARVDWKKLMDNPERIRNYKPRNLVKLPQATKRRQFYADMNYTLQQDIPDGKGGVLYPKGYTFNPLDYTTLNEILIVIDGTKKKQIQWFKASGYANRIGVKLMTTDGNYYTLENKIGQRVYYADKRIIDGFQLEHVPCIINQIKNKMLVTEIGL